MAAMLRAGCGFWRRGIRTEWTRQLSRAIGAAWKECQATGEPRGSRRDHAETENVPMVEKMIKNDPSVEGSCMCGKIDMQVNNTRCCAIYVFPRQRDAAAPHGTSGSLTR